MNLHEGRAKYVHLTVFAYNIYVLSMERVNTGCVLTSWGFIFLFLHARASYCSVTVNFVHIIYDTVAVSVDKATALCVLMYSAKFSVTIQ